MDSVGASSQAAISALDEFLKAIEPDIEQATLSSDPNALEFIKDRIAGASARISNGFFQNQKEAFTAIAMGVLRTAVALA